MRIKGKIASWNDQQGYGFIQPNDGGKRLFVHISAFANRSRRPEPGQVVTYARSTDRQGRPCATRATLSGDRLAQRRSRPAIPAIAVALIFLALLATGVMLARLPLPIFVVYLVVSLVTFVVYAMDKSAARKGAWRTPESTLHMLSLFGGWPGALVAQQRLRHKSRKTAFRAVFWMTVAVNCIALAWMLSPGGTRMLQSMLSLVA